MTCINAVKEFVAKYTKTLKICSIIFLIAIPWMKISKAQLAGSFSLVSFLSIFIMILWILTIHIIFIIMNYTAALLLCVNLQIRKTLAIIPSIKTLAITLSIISFLPPDFGDPGLMSLPLIIGHLCLLLLDSVWVAFWAEKPTKEEISIESGSSDEQNVTDKNINHVTAV